jgi:hypothetical protein
VESPRSFADIIFAVAVAIAVVESLFRVSLPGENENSTRGHDPVVRHVRLMVISSLILPVLSLRDPKPELGDLVLRARWREHHVSSKNVKKFEEEAYNEAVEEYKLWV